LLTKLKRSEKGNTMFCLDIWFVSRPTPLQIVFSDAETRDSAFNVLSELMQDPKAVWQNHSHTIRLSAVSNVVRGLTP